MVVHGIERLLRRTMPVIVRPTPDERVELADDLAGGGLPMFAQIVMDGAQMLHHLALLWRRQDHTPIPAHGEAEEVKAVIDVDDPGLRLAQLQSTLLKKRRQRENDIPLQDLAARCRHHQIVGIAYQTDAVVGTTAQAWPNGSAPVVLGSEKPFHAVKGHIGQHGRGHSLNAKDNVTAQVYRDSVRCRKNRLPDGSG